MKENIMKEKEKKLFKTLCKFKDEFADPSLISFATPAVLGHLFFNRMQGVAYGTLKRNGLLGRVNREFRSSLGAAYDQNILKNESFGKCIALLADILSPCEGKAAMLKGACLYAHYPDGYRTSNDVDLLVLPEDVTVIGKLLCAADFKQGAVRNGEFIPATRKEIIESRMMRGETVPYIKEVNLPFMRFFEVDINFSLDYKNGAEETVCDMLRGIRIKEENGVSIPTLNNEDFFLHLCAHLYKEATTLPWIEMHRDMTLYKYCDIYMLLSEMTDTQLRSIFARADRLGLEKVCAYAVLETVALFDMECPLACRLSQTALENDPCFRLRIASPRDKSVLIYRTSDANERFFLQERENDLREAYEHEKA